MQCCAALRVAVELRKATCSWQDPLMCGSEYAEHSSTGNEQRNSHSSW